MKLLDLNLLLYAVNQDAAQHQRAKAWLEAALAGAETVALPWTVLLGFLRVSTHPRVFEAPLTPERATEIVDGWLARPNVVTLNPGDGHWAILRSLLSQTGTAGNLTTDSHLAAMAIENGCELCSTDSDFARFRRVRRVNPIADE